MNRPGPYPQAFVRWNLLDPEDAVLLLAVLGLPWIFGGVTLYGYRTAAFLIVVAAAIMTVRQGLSAFRLSRMKWLLPALLLAGWAAFQLVPLPPSLVGLLSPTAHGIYSNVFPGYATQADSIDVVAVLEQQALDRVPEADGVPFPPREKTTLLSDAGPGGRWTGWRPLSLMPISGSERIHWYAVLLVAFLIVCARTRDDDVAGQYRAVMFAGFIALALFGLLQAATGDGRIYWKFDVGSTGGLRPFGPYVNPTNFAAVMEMAVPWLAGYALSRGRRLGWNLVRDLKTPIFASGALLCLIAGFAAASKAAAAFMIVSLTLLVILASKGARNRIWVIGGVVATWAIGAIAISLTRLGDRVQEYLQTTGANLDQVDRVVAWKAAVPMLKDYWLTGSGFGSFSDAFAHYVPAGDHLRWEQLHNDYFELLIEGGLIAGVLVAWLAIAYWRRLLFVGEWHGRHGLRLEQVGLLCGLVALCLHGLFDFNHQIPANALIFVVMAGYALTRGGSIDEETA